MTELKLTISQVEELLSFCFYTKLELKFTKIERKNSVDTYNFTTKDNDTLQVKIKHDNTYVINKYDNKTNKLLHKESGKINYEKLNERNITNKAVFEVEDNNGNTALAFEVDFTDTNDIKVTQTKNCEWADNDDDYIFCTNNKLTRIHPI